LASLITDGVLSHENANAETEAFCAEVREGSDVATFEDKRRYFELLDVRGKLALENGEKVVYVLCKIGKPRPWPTLTSPLSSNHKGHTITVTARLVLSRLKEYS
jgi:hypothetical protein